MFAENLSDFFDTSYGFAVTATYNGETLIDGIFDDEYFEVDDSHVGHQSRQPFFLCRSVLIAAVALGDMLIIADEAFDVVTIEPDGTGVTRLKLERNPVLLGSRMIATGELRMTSTGAFRTTS